MVNLAKDEKVIFLPTAAFLSDDESHWHVPVHGWVFEPDESRFRKGLIENLIKQKYGLSVDAESQVYFDSRIGYFLVDNKRGKRLDITIGDKSYRLNESKPNGHFHTELMIPVHDVAKNQSSEKLHFNLVLEKDDHRIFYGYAHLVEKKGLSIISDIDDTVKYSFVNDRRKLVESSLFNKFDAVDGMASFYQRLAKKKSVQFHFVSSSPWHLYPSLSEFFEASGFPSATFSLKTVRLKDKTFLDLFKKGTETKPEQIEPLLKRYPARQFILIGDSGEQDPEVYAQIANRYGDQIVKILIRNVQSSSATDHIQAVFSKLESSKWQLFNSVEDIRLDEY